MDSIDLDGPQGLALARELLDCVPTPVFVKDEEHRWIVQNDASAALVGVPKEEMLGKSDFDYFPAEEAEVFWRQDDLVLSTGEENVNEERLTSADGRTQVIVTRKRLLVTSSGKRYVIGTIQDVTAIRELEQKLREDASELERRIEERTSQVEQAKERLQQSQKLEALGQLTGGIAHDFNNLLAIMMMNLEVARHRVRDRPEALSVLSDAIETVERGSELTSQLLSFARKQALRPRVTDVNRLMARIARLFQGGLPHGIQMEISPSPTQVSALVDTAQLENALLNLCINARDAMPDGGSLGIEARVITVAGEHEHPVVRRGRWTVVRVSDTGVGIPEADLGRVFEPFYTTKSERGSGLGLSMVHGFVHQSNGRIYVESKEQEGTAISLYLPWVDVDGRAPSDDLVEAFEGSSRSETILVIDDEPMIVKLTTALADSLGYQVITASTPEEALAVAEANPQIDVVIADVVLTAGPVGPSLARQIVSRIPGCQAVLMSGYTDIDLDESWDEAQLLRKPFRASEFAAAIRRAIRRSERS